jgi:hypothetical protein
MIKKLKKIARCKFPNCYDLTKKLYYTVKYSNKKPISERIAALPLVYEQRITGLRKKKKISAAFVITSSAKWGYSLLYQLLIQAGIKAYVLICLHNGCTKEEFISEINFFKKINIPAYPLFDLKNNREVLIRKYRPDIIFYTEVWHLSHENFLSKQQIRTHFRFIFIAKTDDNMTCLNRMTFNKVYTKICF